MDLLTIIQAVFRRWYVALPIGLITLSIAGAMQVGLPSEYEARGSVLLEEPQLDPSRLPASTVSAEILIDRLESGGTLADLASGDARILPLGQDGQTVEVTATASNGTAAETSVERTLDWLTEAATDLQDAEEIAEGERLRPVVLTPTISAEAQEDGAYTASGTFYLRDPSAGAENPYRAGQDTARLLQEVIASDQVRAQIRERTAPGVSFDVTSGRDSGPIMNITLNGSDPAALLEAYRVVSEALDTELDQRQARAEVPESRRIVVTPLAAPQSVADVSPPLNRAVAAIVGVGGVLALGATLAADSLLTRRRLGKATSATTSSIGDSGQNGRKASPWSGNAGQPLEDQGEVSSTRTGREVEDAGSDILSDRLPPATLSGTTAPTEKRRER